MKSSKIFPFYIFGVAFLGIAITTHNNGSRKVTPPYVISDKPDPVTKVEPKKDSIKPRQKLYRYVLQVKITPDNVIYTARNSGYQQVTIDAHYTKPQLYYQIFTSPKAMSIEEASAYANNNPDKVETLSQQEYNLRYGNDSSSEYDYFIDNFDAYFDDPENLDEYPDEVFDFLLD